MEVSPRPSSPVRFLPCGRPLGGCSNPCLLSVGRLDSPRFSGWIASARHNSLWNCHLTAAFPRLASAYLDIPQGPRLSAGFSADRLDLRRPAQLVPTRLGSPVKLLPVGHCPDGLPWLASAPQDAAHAHSHHSRTSTSRLRSWRRVSNDRPQPPMKRLPAATASRAASAIQKLTKNCLATAICQHSG
jgi:hypothetical protein